MPTVYCAFSSLFIGIGFVTQAAETEADGLKTFSSLFIGIGFVTGNCPLDPKKCSILSVPFSSGLAL